MSKIFSKKNLILFIFATLVISVVFIGIRIVLAPTISPDGEASIREKSDYILMLLQSILGVVAMILPGIISKRINITIPTNMFLVYALFLYCAIYLGEVRAFYYKVAHWDTILHAFSGAMLGALGFSFICLLNNTNTIPFNLTPLFVAAFGFCFAVSLGVIWEIYEYSADIILGTNMQKFKLASGDTLTGQAALADTMKDLIVDSIGAFVMSVIGYVSIKYKNGWLNKFLLKRRTVK